MIYIVMGVEGSGKTTIGELLAQHLGCAFLDADRFHSPENIKKMAAGHPLTDADRMPWLAAIHAALTEFRAASKDVVLACSALKQSYREILEANLSVTWIYLKVDRAELAERIANRKGHYANVNLLDSQLATLEEPTDAITVDGNPEPDVIVENILAALPQQN
jgi:gluconokinase